MFMQTQVAYKMLKHPIYLQHQAQAVFMSHDNFLCYPQFDME